MFKIQFRVPCPKWSKCVPREVVLVRFSVAAAEAFPEAMVNFPKTMVVFPSFPRATVAYAKTPLSHQPPFVSELVPDLRLNFNTMFTPTYKLQ